LSKKSSVSTPSFYIIIFKIFQKWGGSGDGVIEGKAVNFKFISDQVDKYSVFSESINFRQSIIFEEVADFIDNIMEVTSPFGYHFPNGFEFKTGKSFGPKIGVRMEWFKKKRVMYLTNFMPTRPQGLKISYMSRVRVILLQVLHKKL